MTAMDFGLLLLRLVLGLTIAAHGYDKFFRGGRIPATAGWFGSIGMKPGVFHARVAASTELSAGLGLAAGLLTPVPAAGFVALMLVAAWTVHRKNGFFSVKAGWEYNLILGVAGVALAATGAGRISLDYLLFRDTGLWNYLQGWVGFLVAAVLGLAGGIGQLVLFYRPPVEIDTPQRSPRSLHTRHRLGRDPHLGARNGLRVLLVGTPASVRSAGCQRFRRIPVNVATPEVIRRLRWESCARLGVAECWSRNRSGLHG